MHIDLFSVVKILKFGAKNKKNWEIPSHVVVFTEPCGRVVVNIRNIEAPPRCARLIFIKSAIVIYPSKGVSVQASRFALLHVDDDSDNEDSMTGSQKKQQGKGNQQTSQAKKKNKKKKKETAEISEV